MNKNIHLKLDEETNRLLKIYKNLYKLDTLPEAGAKAIKDSMEDLNKALNKMGEQVKG